MKRGTVFNCLLPLMIVACYRVTNLDVPQIEKLASQLNEKHQPGREWIFNPNAEAIRHKKPTLLPENSIIKIKPDCPLILQKSDQFEGFNVHIVALKCSRIRDIPGYFLGGFVQCDDENEMYQSRFKLQAISNQLLYFDEHLDTYVTSAHICKKLKKHRQITGEIFIKSHRASFWSIFLAD